MAQGLSQFSGSLFKALLIFSKFHRRLASKQIALRLFWNRRWRVEFLYNLDNFLPDPLIVGASLGSGLKGRNIMSQGVTEFSIFFRDLGHFFFRSAQGPRRKNE